jgi:hypothetical protein
MLRIHYIAILFLALSTLAVAEKIPADAWISGRLIDVSESWHTRGGGQVNSYNGQIHGGMAIHEYPIIRYVIDDGQYIYEADLVLRRKNEKQPVVTVNGDVTFAFYKSNLYLRSEDGREYKLVIAKKTIKNPDTK